MRGLTLPRLRLCALPVRRFLALGFALVLAGCTAILTGSHPRRDDGGSADVATRGAGAGVPVIVIPGMLGSRIVEAPGGRTVWPSFPDLLLGLGQLERLEPPFPGMADAPADSALGPAGIIRRVGPIDFYAGLIAGLERHHGSCVAPEDIAPTSGCVILAWDWRADLVAAAGQLDDTVAALRAAREAPDLTVDVIAHSAGGLVARYFKRFGRADVLDRDRVAQAPMTGAPALRRVALIATPNGGSIYGLQRVMRGERLGLSRMHPEVMATMPSIYALLPHPDRDWMITTDGAIADIDLYDVASWERFGEAIFHPQARERLVRRFPDPARRAAHVDALRARFVDGLVRGGRFHRALDAPPAQGHDLPQMLAIAAGCHDTPAVCLIEEVDGQPVIRLDPGEISNPVPGVDYHGLMLAPGDARVTIASARSTPAPGRVFQVCRRHDQLPSDPATVAAILRFLNDAATDL